MDLQQYWEVLQQKICPRCLDGDGKGICRLPASEECALKLFLPQIVASVAAVKTDSIETHINALRKDVCTLCDHRAADLTCKKRSDLECALDRYFLLVVEIVESVKVTMQSAEAGYELH